MKVRVRSTSEEDNITDPEIVEAFLAKIDNALSDPYISDDDESVLTGIRAWVSERGRYTTKQHWRVLKVIDATEDRYMRETRSDDDPPFFDQDT